MLRKHTLMIFTWERTSLWTPAVGDRSEESDWLVRDMLLQERVLVSPDITHSLDTHTDTQTATALRHPWLSKFSVCCFFLPHTENR